MHDCANILDSIAKGISSNRKMDVEKHKGVCDYCSSIYL